MSRPRPVTSDDFQATLFHYLVDVGRARVDASLPRKVIDRTGRGTPIAELF